MILIHVRSSENMVTSMLLDRLRKAASDEREPGLLTGSTDGNFGRSPVRGGFAAHRHRVLPLPLQHWRATYYYKLLPLHQAIRTVYTLPTTSCSVAR